MNIKSKLDGCTAFSFVKLGQDKWKNINVSCSFKIKHMHTKYKMAIIFHIEIQYFFSPKIILKCNYK